MRSAVFTNSVPMGLRHPLDNLLAARRSLARTEQEHAPVDHRSFRDQLAFSIGFAVARSREVLRRILADHVTDDARHQLAERVIEHLEQSGFEIDEAEQVMKRRPPTPRHG